MIEESVESFILQYKPYAAVVEVLPHLEGAPLLECVVVGAILHVLERTGPYLAKPGKLRLIINPTAMRLERAAEPRKELSTVALSSIRASGLVLERERHTLIVDAGAPLVVSVFGAIPPDIASGEWVRFESLAPVHGFVVPSEERPFTPRGREVDSDSL